MSFDKEYAEYSAARAKAEMDKSLAYATNRNRIEKTVENFLIGIFNFVDSPMFHGNRYVRTRDDSNDDKNRTALFTCGAALRTIAAEIPYKVADDALSFGRQHNRNEKISYASDNELPLKITITNNVMGKQKSVTATVIITQVDESDVFNIDYSAFANTVFGLLYDLDRAD